MRFHVAEGITLAADAVTQTYGFFGRKGSGKTFAAGERFEHEYRIINDYRQRGIALANTVLYGN